MVSLLCVSDLHDNEAKLKQLEGFSEGCDAIITAGDDLDKELPGHQYEANVLLKDLLKKHQPKSRVRKEQIQYHNKLIKELQANPTQENHDAVNKFIEENPELKELIQSESGKNSGYLNHFAKRAEAVNEFYLKTNLLGFGTLGNHDPLPVALGRINAIKYLLGETAEFKGLNIAGLPATGEWTEASGSLHDFYAHLKEYRPASDEQEGETSELVKKLLEHKGKIDVFVTHKAYKEELQNWDPIYAENDQFGVDAGAQAVDKKFKPTLNVFGHYHLKRAKVKRSNDGKQWFLYVGPNAAVKVHTGKDKKPKIFESCYYR